MRHVFILLTASAAVTLAACNSRKSVQCAVDSNCNLSSGGVCSSAASGNQWCSYPDANCASGLRYSDQDTGDGLAGSCVAASMIDAGFPFDARVTDAGGSAAPASCLALPSTCGSEKKESCCTTLSVPSGTYYRSYDLAGDANSGDMTHPATVSEFRLDKYEVTVSRFRAFLAAGQGTQAKPPVTGTGTHPKITGSGWQADWNTQLAADTNTLTAGLKCSQAYQTWTDTQGGNENLPINCVTWYEAMAFCIWDGGRLPTEAEWNYAATGGDSQRAFAWSVPSSSVAIDGTYASVDCLGDGNDQCAATDILAVGSRPTGDGRWGHSDLTGNMSEWTLDWLASYSSDCTDCANLTVATRRVYRGGSFLDFKSTARTAVRPTGGNTGTPTLRNPSLGFRCAR